MEDNEKISNLLTTRVRQLILKFNELKKQNLLLQQEIKQRDEQITQLKQQVNAAQKKYDDLMITKMIAISNNDMDQARKKLTHIIRNINKCITMLSQ